MKNKWNNIHVKWGVTAFLVVSGSIFFYYLLFHTSNIRLIFASLSDILLPVSIGFILAYLLVPVLNYCEQKFLYPICNLLKLKDKPKTKKYVRMIGITITSILFWFLLLALIYMLLSQIVPSIQSIIFNFDTYANNIYDWINKTLADNPNFAKYAINMLERYSTELENFLNNTLLPKSSELLKSLSMSIISLIATLWDFIVGFLISIYLMSSKEIYANQAKKIAYSVFKRDTANLVINNVRFTHNTFIGFIGGKIVDSIIIGLLCFIGTTLLQTPYAVLISVVIGCTNVIPFFGPFLGGIPCTFLVLVVDITHPLNAVYFALFVLLLQTVDGNIIGPKILGESTGLSSFWVIFSITLFGGLFGVLGMVIGVPAFAVIYAAIKAMVNNSLIKKEMPTDSEAYSTVEFMDENGFRYVEVVETKNSKGKKDIPQKNAKTGKTFVSNNAQWDKMYKAEKKTLKEQEEK